MKAKLQTLLLAIGVATMGISSANAADRGNPNPGIIPPQASYAGKTQGEWLQEWWNWVYGTTNYVQMYDGTGELAHINGNGDRKVFFLAKSWAGVPQTRHVTIPAGRAIYVPVMGNYNDSWSGITDHEELKAAVLGTIPGAHDLAVTIDGRPVVDIWRYKQITGIFTAYDVNFPPYVFYPAFGYEVSLLLRPLPPGHHVIHMQGSYLDEFTTDVTYHITVLPQQRLKAGGRPNDCDDGKGKQEQDTYAE